MFTTAKQILTNVPELNEYRILGKNNADDITVQNIVLLDATVALKNLAEKTLYFIKIKGKDEIESLISQISRFNPVVSSGFLFISRSDPNLSAKDFFVSIPSGIDSSLFFIFTEQDIRLLAYKASSYINQALNKQIASILEINTTYAKKALKNEGLDSMLLYFKEIVKNPVAVYDQNFDCIASTDPILQTPINLNGPSENIFLNNLYFTRKKINVATQSSRNTSCNFVYFPISYEKKDRAYLAVLEINNPLGDVDFYAMEIAATSILMEMKRRLAIKSIEERNINNFIYDLIYQSDKKEKEILHEAHSLDLIYTAHYATIIIEFKLLGEDSGKNRSLEYFSPLQDELIFNSIVKYFKELNERNTIGQLGTSVIVLYSFSNDTASNADTVKCVCDKLRQNFSLDYPDHIIQVGAGSICSGILGMSESYNDARTALTYGLRTFGRSSFVIQYNDNSLLKIISCLEDSIDIRSLIPKVLFDIMDYDQQHHSDFLNTLSNYLNNNCNASETAAQMFVHNKTIQYRLDRIRSLFHLDYNDCDERFGLTFGVKALNLLDNTK